jgi:hypothetical protein
MDLVVPSTAPEDSVTVTAAEIAFIEHAAKTSVAETCRVFGMSRPEHHRDAPRRTHCLLEELGTLVNAKPAVHSSGEGEA